MLNPTVERVILNMPAGVTNPANPRYSEDGQSISSPATPTAGGRAEIYQINVDGTHLECVTCGVIHERDRQSLQTGSLRRRFRAGSDPRQRRRPVTALLISKPVSNGCPNGIVPVIHAIGARARIPRHRPAA